MGSNVRIIAGEFRGRRLAAPKTRGTRPSTERLREALFNLCGAWIEDKRVLDLFAGTGAMGLEAISRGAHHTTFVECNRLALQHLNRNIENLELEERTEVLSTEVGKALPLLQNWVPFDLIYIDPPYGQNLLRLHQILTLIERHHLLATGGRLFLEEASSPEGLPPLDSLELKQVRRYGRTHLWEMVCQKNL